MDFDNLKAAMSGGTGFLPDLEHMFDKVEILLRVVVMAGPLLLLGFGLLYLLASPKEANHTLGYRFYWGMSSVEVWQFTQRLAGMVWTVLGLVLSIAMAVVCSGFRELARDAMIFSAMRAVLWELALVVVSILAIDITVVALFDRKGYRRRRNRG